MSETLKYLSVKFSTTNKTYTFSTTDDTIKNGDDVVVETQRGLEFASVVTDLFDRPNVSMEVKEIVRKATDEDRAQFKQNKIDAEEAKNVCQNESDKLNLGMNIISAEYTLDRSKVTFIYLADDRVDFRELLKVLASIFRCRIDLRQVGTRDKAKMVSGIGMCGRELCCAKFITDFDRISINMAKNQLLALNIQKLSGQCGNLMCCLRFEDDAYKDLRKDLPKMNSMVEYEGNRYRITSMNVITKTCKLENSENAMFISLEELKKNGRYNRPNKEENQELRAQESIGGDGEISVSTQETPTVETAEKERPAETEAAPKKEEKAENENRERRENRPRRDNRNRNHRGHRENTSEKKEGNDGVKKENPERKSDGEERKGNGHHRPHRHGHRNHNGGHNSPKAEGARSDKE